MFSKNLTKEGFQIIINEVLAPFLVNYPIEGVRLIQDNDGKHSSQLCLETLVEHNIQWVFSFIS